MMANEQNLKPLSTSKAREIGSKGGKASAKARKERKAMKEQMEMLLTLPVKSSKTKEVLKKLGIKSTEMNNQMALIVALYQTALKGGKNSVTAFNTIMEMTEEKEKETGKETLEKLDEVLKGLGGVV